MKTSATSFIKSILLIGYAQDYRVLLSKNFTTILPDATIDEYNIKDGCPGSAYNWKKHQLVIIDYDLGDGENGLEWIRACSASNDFPAVIMLTGKNNESVIVQAFR